MAHPDILARAAGRMESLNRISGSQLIGDSFFALLSRLAPRVASTLLFVILMRQEGSLAAGAFSLSIAFLTVGVLLSSLGLEELIVRKVAKAPTLSAEYVLNLLFLRTILSVIGFGILIGITTLILNYSTDVKHIIVLQGFGLVPEGLTTTMFAFFNGRQKLNWMAFVSVCVSGFQMALGGLALWIGAPLQSLILILLGGSFLGTIISAIFMCKLLATKTLPSSGIHNLLFKVINWQPDWSFCKQQMRLTKPFALITTLASLDLQLDIILLSFFGSMEHVGFYSAARTIILVLSLFPQAFRMSIYPSIVKAFHTSDSELRSVYRRAWRYLAMSGLPIVLGCAILSKNIISLVYHHTHITAAWSLSLLSVHLLVGFLYIPGTRLMVASNRQTELARLLGISLSINFLLSLLLVPRYGAFGSAVSRMIASVLYFALVEIFVAQRLLPCNKGPSTVLRPLVVSVLMSLPIWILRTESLFLTVLLGATIYGSVSVVLGNVTLSELETVLNQIKVFFRIIPKQQSQN